MARVKGTITSADGTTADATLDAVRAALGTDAFFWLDLDGLDADGSRLLLDGFGFHALAVEDAEHFGQRPKVEEFEGFTYLVVHGAQIETPSATVEVHVFYSSKHVVTVHRGASGVLDAVRDRLGRHRVAELSPPEISIL